MIYQGLNGRLRALSGLALAAGLALAGAGPAAAATLQSGAGLSFDTGFFDPETGCTPNLAGGFAGDIDFAVTGAVGNVSALADSVGGPRAASDIQTAQLIITNNSNATCEIFGISFQGQASTLLTPTGPFEQFPEMTGEGVAEVVYTAPDGSQTVRRSQINEDSSRLSPPFDPDYFLFDAFSFDPGLTLAPGEDARFDMTVSATAQVVPLPPAAAGLGAGLLLLAGLARRRRV